MELTCLLLYLGKASLDLRTRLRQTLEINLPYCKLKSFLDLTVIQRFTGEKNRFRIISLHMSSNCKFTYYSLFKRRIQLQ